MVVQVRVEVRGLRELATAFKAVDKEAANQLKVRFLGVAQMVAGAAAAKVPHVTGRAAASIKPRATPRGAAIAFGGSAAEYYPWLDFGGRVGRNKSIERPFIQEGRYVYPTIRDKQTQIMQATDEAIKQAALHEGFETKGGL